MNNDPLSDRYKMLGEWVYNSVFFNDGSVQTYNGNIITTTSGGGPAAVFTNTFYSSFVFDEKNSCLWKTCYTNGNTDTNTGTWSINENDNLLTLTKVYYTNIILTSTNVYFVYHYVYTYEFDNEDALKITSENDSYYCIMENNTSTNYSSNNIDAFAAAGVSYAVIGKKK